MTTSHQLQAANGPQIIPIAEGSIRSYAVALSFGEAPTAGTVTVETQAIGSSEWAPVSLGEDVDITSGQAAFSFDGAVRFVRVTFSGLVGGVMPVLWVSSQDVAAPPFDLMTDGGNGPNRRLRVDIGQTGFFAGREFRTFREFSIAAGQTLVLKIVVPINAILLEQAVELDSGSLRVTNATAGTPGGTFSETLPIIGKNNMSERPTPLYAPQIVFTAGGTHTGGFIFDVHRVVAATATAQQSTVGNIVGDERGVAVGTYYVRYENFGAGPATGTLWFIWEERP